MLLIALLFWRCNEPSSVIEDLRFNEVAIPNNLKTDITNGRVSSQDIDIEEIEVKVITDDGKEIIGKMRFTIPIGEDNTLSTQPETRFRSTPDSVLQPIAPT